MVVIRYLRGSGRETRSQSPGLPDKFAAREKAVVSARAATRVRVSGCLGLRLKPCLAPVKRKRKRTRYHIRASEPPFLKRRALNENSPGSAPECTPPCVYSSGAPKLNATCIRVYVRLCFPL